MTAGRIAGPRIHLSPNPSAEPNTSSAVKPASPGAGSSHASLLPPPVSPSGFENLRKFLLSCMNCLPIDFTPSSERMHRLAVKHYVRSAYQDLRFFHGTSQSSLESIRRNGMSRRLKKQGATVGFFGSGLVKRMPLGQRARQYHYFTSEKHVAARYANWSAKPLRGPQKSGADAVPKLARLFYVRGFTKMKDWDEIPKNRAYRTRSDIPRHAVRQEKGADRYSEEILTGLQERIEQRFNVSLNTSEIERTLLDDVESDSDNDDFPGQ